MADPSDGDHSRTLNHVLVPPAGEFHLDPVHTFVSFTVQHLIVGRVRGRFETVRGTVTVAEDISASTLEVSIDAASLTTLNPIRDADLRSEHFLDVERYPTSTYRSTTVSALPDATTPRAAMSFRPTGRTHPPTQMKEVHHGRRPGQEQPAGHG